MTISPYFAVYEAAVSIAKIRHSVGLRKFIDLMIKKTTEETRINKSIDVNGKQKHDTV